MSKRMIAALLAIGMVFLNVPMASANSILTVPLSASATLAPIGTNSLAATLVSNPGTPPTAGNGNLQFGPSAGSLVAEGDEIIKIVFSADNDSAGDNFKSVLIWTNNTAGSASPQSTSDFPAGLVHTTDQEPAPGIQSDITTPLHWVVFESLAEAQGWGFINYVHGVDPDFAVPPRTSSEPVDTRIQLFVSDLAGSDGGANPFAQGYATVLLGLTGTVASLANIPFNDSPACQADPQSCNYAGDTNNRDVSNGESYMVLAGNFTTSPAGSYATNTLSLEMVNNL